MKPRVRVVGVGTAHGDDAVGLEAVRLLQAQLSPDAAIDFHFLDSPQRLVDLVEGVESLVVIDAFRSAGGNPGTIHSLVWPDAQLTSLRTTSTHGFGIVEALQLADALSQPCPKIVIQGIEIDRTLPSDSMSPAVAAALPALIHTAREIISSLGRPVAP